jgi:thiol-disulfide isomerase/thioredoxin
MNYQKLALLFIPLLAACGQKRPEVIERPLFEVRNTSTLEIDKVELNDTATVFHFDAFFYPNMWIMIAADTYIKESGSDERFFITKAEGINIGEHFFMPESGQTSFKLFFPPLDPKITKIDFIESDCDDCFKIWGIQLVPSKKGIVTYKPEKAKVEKLASLPPVEFVDKPAILTGKFIGYQQGLVLPDIQLESMGPIFKPGFGDKIKINEDGTFRMEVNCGLPLLTDLYPWGTKVFLVPGHETTLTIDLKKQSRFESKYRTDKEDGDSAFIYIENDWLSTDDMNILNAICRKTDEKLDLFTLFNTVDGFTTDQYLSWLQDVENSIRSSYADFPTLSEKVKILAEANLKASTYYLANLYSAVIHEAYYRTRNIPHEERQSHPLELEVPADYSKSVIKSFVDENIAYTSSFSQASLDIFFEYNKATFIEANNVEGIVEAFKEQAALDLGKNTDLIADVAKGILYYEKIESGAFLNDEDKANLSAMQNDYVANQLIAYNNKLVELIENNKAAADKGVVINPTPEVAKEKALDVILEKYRGKVVFVDFWATWCGPCISSIEAMKPVKAKYVDKDIVFVYLTGETSPLGTWNKTIPEIKGEHYRVSNEQWEYWYQELEITGIPTFMVFDKEGKLTNRYTGFPGQDTIENSINKNL